MVTAAALSARFHAPVVVWAAASAALLTKGALALALGVGLRRYLPRHVLRYAAVVVCVGMAVLAVVRPER
jgi:putative Ca2+/H+ antiporter (TMEM165/GDT1 family)